MGVAICIAICYEVVLIGMGTGKMTFGQAGLSTNEKFGRSVAWCRKSKAEDGHTTEEHALRCGVTYRWSGATGALGLQQAALQLCFLNVIPTSLTKISLLSPFSGFL